MEYEKLYKEALEKAEKIYNSGESNPDEAAVLSKYLPILFPELKEKLKEIEDEQIRLEIRNFIWEYPDKLPERDRWLAWFDKQDNNKESDEKWEVSTGLYKCTKRMFDGTPEGRRLFEVGNLYKCVRIHKCVTKNDVAEFESSDGQCVFLIDTVVRKHFIKVKDAIEKESEDEKIKREIVAYINELADFKNEKIPTKWLAWLEKQDKKKSADEVLKIRQELYQSGYNDGYKHGKEDTILSLGKESIEALEHFVRGIGESGYASPYDNQTKLVYKLLKQLKEIVK